MLIGGGQYGSVTPLYLAAKGSVILKFPNPSLMHALVVLTASYYVFNIQYPAQEKNMFTFVEATLLQNVDAAKKRVAINKLLQEMEINL